LGALNSARNTFDIRGAGLVEKCDVEVGMVDTALRGSADRRGGRATLTAIQRGVGLKGQERTTGPYKQARKMSSCPQLEGCLALRGRVVESPKAYSEQNNGEEKFQTSLEV